MYHNHVLNICCCCRHPSLLFEMQAPTLIFHSDSHTCKGHMHSLLGHSSKPWFILWNTKSLWLYLALELLGEDNLTPALLLFPIFREVCSVDDSPIKRLPLMLKVAGRRGNSWASLLSLQPWVTGRYVLHQDLQRLASWCQGIGLTEAHLNLALSYIID